MVLSALLLDPDKVLRRPGVAARSRGRSGQRPLAGPGDLVRRHRWSSSGTSARQLEAPPRPQPVRRVLLPLIVIIPGIVRHADQPGPRPASRPVELCRLPGVRRRVPVRPVRLRHPGVGDRCGHPSASRCIQLLGDRNERGIIFLFTSIAVAAVTARSDGPAPRACRGSRSDCPIGSRSQSRADATKRSRGGRGSGRAASVGRRAVDPRRRGGTGAEYARPPSLAPAAGCPADRRSTHDQAELDAPARQDLGRSAWTASDADEKRRLNDSQRLCDRKSADRRRTRPDRPLGDSRDRLSAGVSAEQSAARKRPVWLAVDRGDVLGRALGRRSCRRRCRPRDRGR